MNFDKGDRIAVKCNIVKDKYYTGTIVKVVGNNYYLLCDDGDKIKVNSNTSTIKGPIGIKPYYDMIGSSELKHAIIEAKGSDPNWISTYEELNKRLITHTEGTEPITKDRYEPEDKVVCVQSINGKKPRWGIYVATIKTVTGSGKSAIYLVKGEDGEYDDKISQDHIYGLQDKNTRKTAIPPEEVYNYLAQRPTSKKENIPKNTYTKELEDQNKSLKKTIEEKDKTIEEKDIELLAKEEKIRLLMGKLQSTIDILETLKLQQEIKTIKVQNIINEDNTSEEPPRKIPKKQIEKIEKIAKKAVKQAIKTSDIEVKLDTEGSEAIETLLEDSDPENISVETINQIVDIVDNNSAIIEQEKQNTQDLISDTRESITSIINFNGMTSEEKKKARQSAEEIDEWEEIKDVVKTTTEKVVKGISNLTEKIIPKNKGLNIAKDGTIHISKSKQYIYDDV